MVGPYLDGLWKIEGVFSMRCLTVKKKKRTKGSDSLVNSLNLFITNWIGESRISSPWEPWYQSYAEKFSDGLQIS